HGWDGIAASAFAETTANGSPAPTLRRTSPLLQRYGGRVLFAEVSADESSSPTLRRTSPLRHGYGGRVRGNETSKAGTLCRRCPASRPRPSSPGSIGAWGETDASVSCSRRCLPMKQSG